MGRKHAEPDTAWTLPADSDFGRGFDSRRLHHTFSFAKSAAFLVCVAEPPPATTPIAGHSDLPIPTIVPCITSLIKTQVVSFPRFSYQFLYPVASLSLGTHAVNIVATDSGEGSTTYGPLTFTVAATAGAGPPFGNLDQAVDSATGSTTVSVWMDSLLVHGWAADPTDGAPLSDVKVYIDGSVAGTPTLGIARPDVVAALQNPAYANSGYQILYSLATITAGQHTVTVVATDSGGRSTTFGPLRFTAVVDLPFGNLDAAVDSTTSGTTVGFADMLLVRGWVADPVDGAPMSNVKVYINGQLTPGTLTLGLPRPDVAAALHNSAYTTSGYQLLRGAGALGFGQNSVSVVATNSIGRSTIFGPLLFTVGMTWSFGPPFGNLDQAVDSATFSSTVGHADSLLVRGWAVDQSDGAPLSNVKVYIDGTPAGTPTLGINRPDVAAALQNPAYTNSGYELLYSPATLSIGTHSVTVVAIDSGGRSTTFGPTAFTFE